MGFDSLQEKLTKSLRNLQGKGKLTEKNMESTLQEIRAALLEADVNYNVVKNFLVNVKEASLGQDVLNAVDPGQLLVKIVHDEIVKLLGSDDNSISFKTSGLTKIMHIPTIIMMVGLQGTGKTTHVAKIAKLLKNKQNRKPLIIAGDNIRLAAVEQLKTLGNEIGVEVYAEDISHSALDIVKNGVKYAQSKGYDTVPKQQEAVPLP